MWGEVELLTLHQCLPTLHVNIHPQSDSGLYYYNYKDFNSIVIMALVDSDLKFIYIVVGTNGRVSDGGVWDKCRLSRALEDNTLKISPLEDMPGHQTPVPYVVVANEAFGLKPWMMRPYSRTQLDNNKWIFNYRLSCVHCCVENVFGVLELNRFRVFRQGTAQEPSKDVIITKTACVLHNYLRTESLIHYTYTPVWWIRRTQKLVDLFMELGGKNQNVPYCSFLRKFIFAGKTSERGVLQLLQHKWSSKLAKEHNVLTFYSSSRLP